MNLEDISYSIKAMNSPEFQTNVDICIEHGLSLEYAKKIAGFIHNTNFR